MRDDQEFNIRFVGLVQEYPCLYDHTSAEYHRMNIQEKAWKSIAEELKETVAACKSRWKNLRGNYTKHLRTYTPSGSGALKKRPYYLAECMTFLFPFTKSRISKGNVQVEGKELDMSPEMPDSEGCSHNDETEVDASLQEEQQTSQEEEAEPEQEQQLQKRQEDLEQHNQQQRKRNPAEYSESGCRLKTKKIPTQAISLQEVNKSAFEYFTMKMNGARRASVEKYEDADASFLISILPDMKRMTYEQKRRFKIGILTLAGDIFNELTNPEPGISPGTSSTCSPVSRNNYFHGQPPAFSPQQSESSTHDTYNSCSQVFTDFQFS